MPEDVQEGIEYASEVTMHQSLAKVPSARAYAMAELAKAGVQFYNPSDEELAQWQEVAGHQNSAWDKTKKKLAGSLANFEKLLEASQTQGRFYVHDV
jgi:TRAP-type C4-dicarboxylate transport system substrate-binding protein